MEINYNNYDKTLVSWKILRKILENSKSKKLSKDMRDELVQNIDDFLATTFGKEALDTNEVND